MLLLVRNTRLLEFHLYLLFLIHLFIITAPDYKIFQLHVCIPLKTYVRMLKRNSVRNP